MNQEKLDFLQHNSLPLLQNLPANATGKWGKMNGQQMVEHLSFIFKVSSNKLEFPLSTPSEYLPRFKEFLLSEKEFRENTKAPVQVIPEDPPPLQYASMQEAINELSREIDDFMAYFSDDPEKRTLHAVFGQLNFSEWVQLHHKHVTHHLKQFGLV